MLMKNLHSKIFPTIPIILFAHPYLMWIFEVELFCQVDSSTFAAEF